MSLTKRSYSKKNDWSNIDKFDLDKSYVHYTWEPMIQELFKDKERKKNIEEKINNIIKDSPEKLYPKPDYIFRAFQITPFKRTKVVFIGQDPYFNYEEYKDKLVPQAYGLSFSVPYDFAIPSSLNNIYKNLIKYNHLKDKPEHGNLDHWARQGCLMLNTALTVIDKEKNIHSNLWRTFTDDIIKYINKNTEYCVFVLWGAEAFKKVNMINLDVHDVIVSSHPSGFSVDKRMGSHEAFCNVDHFGKINSYLNTHKKTPIDWRLD
jgi:uracil-DNA glycosylase